MLGRYRRHTLEVPYAICELKEQVSLCFEFLVASIEDLQTRCNGVELPQTVAVRHDSLFSILNHLIFFYLRGCLQLECIRICHLFLLMPDNGTACGPAQLVICSREVSIVECGVLRVHMHW